MRILAVFEYVKIRLFVCLFILVINNFEVRDGAAYVGSCGEKKVENLHHTITKGNPLRRGARTRNLVTR